MLIYNYLTLFYINLIEECGRMNDIMNSVSVIMFMAFLVIIVIMIISSYKIFKKAGKKGWTSLIPIYNLIVSIKIAELPIWYFILCFIPILNIYVLFKVNIETAHKFGKSTGFGVLMIFLGVICYPILAFGKSQYKGDSNAIVNKTDDGNNINLNAINSGVLNFNDPSQFNNGNFKPTQNFNNDMNSGAILSVSPVGSGVINNINDVSTDVNSNNNSNINDGVLPGVAPVMPGDVNNVNLVNTSVNSGNSNVINDGVLPGVAPVVPGDVNNVNLVNTGVNSGNSNVINDGVLTGVAPVSNNGTNNIS